MLLFCINQLNKLHFFIFSLQEGTWGNGDLTDVGVSGSSLSGGQRLRIGVARAVYAYSCSVILLDDPFSSLDTTTASQLSAYLNDVVVGQQHRAVVVATHSVDLLREAATILLLQDGEERARGTYAELQAHCAAFQLLLGDRLAEKYNLGADSIELPLSASATEDNNSHGKKQFGLFVCSFQSQ